MENITVTTMPIKPYEKINIGLMIAPTLVDIIGSIIKCKKVLSFNLLHSFDNKVPVLSNYIGKIKEFNINYDEIKSLRIEAKQKLNQIRPASIGQASRISGVSPADVSVLLVYLGSR